MCTTTINYADPLDVIVEQIMHNVSTAMDETEVLIATRAVSMGFKDRLLAAVGNLFEGRDHLLSALGSLPKPDADPDAGDTHS